MSQWMEIKILTTYDASDAVGEILYRNGANGLVYEDITPVLDISSSINWDYSDIPIVDVPLENVKIVAYLPLSNDILSVIEDIKASIEVLRDFNLNIGEGEVSYHIVNEEDWQDNWKQYFKPINVGEKITVCPIWEEVPETANKIIIRIDPGLAFGTGSHITTQQALILLEKYISPNNSIIDVGCGSGILTITAGYLGAKNVLALDNDEQAVAMAERNIALNSLTECQINVMENDLLLGIGDKAEIIVANITAPILKRLIPQTLHVNSPGGLFICAGIISEYELEVQRELLQANYIVIDRMIKNDWVALAARRVL